jgi:3-phenylpropionate/trans-cinnamate dioxygenase ferredoxin subunit
LAEDVAEGTFVRAAPLDDVPPNALLGVEIDGRRVCLANADGRIYAFADNCTHRDFPMHSGELEDGEIECAWHGAKFDIESGRATRLPAVKPLQTYPVKIEDGAIWVAV